jgi:hypothetical protein
MIFTKIRAHILLIPCLVFILQAQNQDTLQIAVIDLSNTGGISQEESGTLTNRLRSMLVLTNAFIVLERGKMQGILDEQGFQQSGCTSTECVVEMGKLLNVQKIISGSIGKLGKIYTTDISLIDIKTARIEKSFIFDHEGEIGGLLKIMETIAANIASTVTGLKKGEKKFGRIQIKSEPRKSNIYLDEQLVGSSPLVLKEVPVGTHNLQVKANGYEDYQRKIMISGSEPVRVNIKLRKLYKFSVKSSPAGASILINNQEAGMTPFNSTVKDGVKFEIKLVKENYQEWKKQIMVKGDIEIDKKLEFSKKYKEALAAKAKGEKAKSSLQPKKGSSKAWLWIGGGAAILAGGAAYYFLTREEEKETVDEGIGLPAPVGRPE